MKFKHDIYKILLFFNKENLLGNNNTKKIIRKFILQNKNNKGNTFNFSIKFCKAIIKQ